MLTILQILYKAKSADILRANLIEAICTNISCDLTDHRNLDSFCKAL
jgi:hypothetical protein